ncbi:nitrogenase component 1 [Clostridium paraputrificum]|uniref:nitrogenase component 1 n=1 Tax=Clostridium paraputrificum TaxID=29363 RepID=UPI003D3387B3
MGILDSRQAPIREKRLRTLSAYYGKVDKFKEENKNGIDKQKIRTFSQGTYDEIIYALEVVSNIEDSVIVIHGPAGCSNGKSHFKNIRNKCYVSNIDEGETILGGDDSLRNTIELAFNENKNVKVIFILSTPVIAINNDDILGIVSEIENEIGAKIIFINTDGFKSRVATNGYDLALYSIGKNLINDKEKKEEFINLISISESPRDVEAIVLILKELGISINLIPRYSEIESFNRAGKGKVTIALNDTQGNILGEILKEEFNVPYIKSNTPIGILNTSNWIRLIAEEFGLTNEAKEFIEKERLKVDSLLREAPLYGLSFYIDLSTEETFSFINMIEELGGKVIGITLEEIDEENKEKLSRINDDIELHIANGQQFEIANILNKLKPDIYISNKKSIGWVVKLGVTPISIDRLGVYGFQGLSNVVNAIKRIRSNRGFINNIGKKENLNYRKVWINKSTNWFIKQEVK